jgi:flagellar hook-associated protein 2
MAESLTSISGISSGIDSKALVEAILAQDRRPADRMQAQVTANGKRRDAFGQLRTLLLAIQDAAKSMREGTALASFSASTSGTTSAGKALFSASAAAGATPATYQVEVKSLTATQKHVGSAQPSASAGLALAGTFEVAGQAVTVDAGDSLVAVRDKINALNLGATRTKVTASIIGGSPTDQRLVLTSDQPGTAGAYALADGPEGVLASLGLAGPPSTAAADATIVIDGAVTVTRSSNTIADAIPGVTLTLGAAEVGRVGTVQVERYLSGVQGNVQAFVDAYNKAVDFLTAQGNPAGSGALRNDALVRTVRSTLAATLLGEAAGGPDGMTTLGAAGLSVDKAGRLSISAARLNAAVTDRFADVAALLADRGAAFVDATDTYTLSGSGVIDQRSATLDTRTTTLRQRVADVDSRLEKKRAALLARFSKFEAALGSLKSIGDSLAAQLKGLQPRDR